MVIFPCQKVLLSRSRWGGGIRKVCKLSIWEFNHEGLFIFRNIDVFLENVYLVELLIILLRKVSTKILTADFFSHFINHRFA